jgi:hypothetical protein
MVYGLEDGEYYFLVNMVNEETGEIDEDRPPVYIGEFGVEGKKLSGDVSEINLTEEVEINDEGQEVEINRVIDGFGIEPGVFVLVSFQSVVLSSIVIADANGEFELEVPDELPEGDHEVIVYAYKEDGGIISNISRLLFTK